MMKYLHFNTKAKSGLARVVKPACAILFTGALLQNSAMANVDVEMHKVTEAGKGQPIGTITLTENDHGVVFTPNLTGLTPGLHGFHVHQNASCGPKKKNNKIVPGGAAGGHYDPQDSKHHDSPWANGHLGDLPALYVNESGQATSPVLAPRLTLSLLKQHAVMIHKGSDNYADEPKPLGGGGKRVACGVIKQ